MFCNLSLYLDFAPIVTKCTYFQSRITPSNFDIQ